MQARATSSMPTRPGVARGRSQGEGGSVSFGEVLRRISVGQGRQGMAQTAAAIGLPMAGFNARLTGRGRFSVAELAAVLRLVPDQRLIKWLFSTNSLPVVRYADEQGAAAAPGPAPQDVLVGVGASIEILLGLVDPLTHGAPLAQHRSDVIRQIDVAMAAIVSMRRQAEMMVLAEAPAEAIHSDARFGALVKQALLANNISLAEVAAALGLTNNSFYARITGRVSFDPAELQTLFRLYPDPHMADVLLAGTPFLALPPRSADATPLRTGVQALCTVLRLVTLPPDTQGEEQAGAAIALRRLNDALRALIVMRQMIERGRLYHPRFDESVRRKSMEPYRANALPFVIVNQSPPYQDAISSPIRG